MSDSHRKTIATYDIIASEFSTTKWTSFWPEEIKQFIKLLPSNKILDIGCGAGRDIDILLETKPDLEIIGIDASSKMLAEAKKRNPDTRFEQMDFRHLAFPDQTFDGFWATASLLHLPKAEVPATLLEIKRVLKSSGVGFISLKTKTSLDEDLIKEQKHDGLERYFAFYKDQEFVALLTQAGFNILDQGHKIEDDERQTDWLKFFVNLLN